MAHHVSKWNTYHPIAESLIAFQSMHWMIETKTFWACLCNNTQDLELECNFAGEAHSLKVEKILFQGKSDYQNVMVFQVQHLQKKIIICLFLFRVSFFILTMQLFFLL